MVITDRLVYIYLERKKRRGGDQVDAGELMEATVNLCPSVCVF